MKVKIQLYRILGHSMSLYGFQVQKWDGSQYSHVTSFRSESEAISYIKAAEQNLK
jgi:hypothetical protein